MANGQLGEDSLPNCPVARDLRSRFEVQGSQPRRGARAWMLDVGCWMLDVGCWMLDVQCWMFSVGCSVLDVQCWMFSVGCSVFLARRSRFAVGLRCPQPPGCT